MQTLVSAFENRERAHRAVEKLSACGFADENVNVRDESEAYSHDVHHGQVVVVVNARDEAEAEVASAVLNEAGAIGRH
jgi:stress-induced morphogen